MHNLAIIFERVINRGFQDEKDKKSSKGELVKGTRGEHTEEWRCEICDKLGWPVAGHSAEYFIGKVRNGYKPIRVDNLGAFPVAWSKDQKERVDGVLSFIVPLVEANKAAREANERTESKAERESFGKSKAASPKALSTAGTGSSL